jgi:hypothetical protein
MIKVLKKLRIEGTFLNIIKTICGKPRTNIILTGEQLKQFPIKSGMRQECPFSSLLFNIVLEFQARAKIQGRNKSLKREGRNQTILIGR